MQTKNEGILGQTWGALKGAAQGWKQQGFEDYGQTAVQQGRISPQQLELRRVNYAITDLYNAINKMENLELQQEVLQHFMPFFQSIRPLFNKYQP